MQQSGHAFETVYDSRVDRHTCPLTSSRPGEEGTTKRVLGIQLLAMECVPIPELPTMVEDGVLGMGNRPVDTLLLINRVHRNVLCGDEIIVVTCRRGVSSSCRLRHTER